MVDPAVSDLTHDLYGSFRRLSERVKGEGSTRGLATQEGNPRSASQPPPVSRSESCA